MSRQGLHPIGEKGKVKSHRIPRMAFRKELGECEGQKGIDMRTALVESKENGSQRVRIGELN